MVQHTDNLKLGVLCSLFASLSLALMGMFVKLAGNQLPISMPLFFRFGISFIVLAPFLIRNKNFDFRVSDIKHFIARIVFGFLALFSLFYAIKFIPLVDALLLNNTAALFIPIVAFLITRAKTPKLVWLGIVIGFIGVMFVLNPGKEIISIGAIIGLCSGLFAAISIVEIRIISKNNTSSQNLFYYFLVGVIVTGIISIFQWKTPSAIDCLYLVFVGIFGLGYQWFSTLAFKYAPVRIITVLLFSSLVFGGIIDWLVWSEIPELTLYIGSIMIVVGAIVSVYFGYKALNKPEKKHNEE